MMKTITGHFLGSGADIYICIGFVPDWVRLYNMEIATQEGKIEWNIQMMRTAEISEGVQISGTTVTALTAGNGIVPYYGGEVITAATAGSPGTYGEGVYRKRDNKDYRYGDDGDAVSVDIDTWTLYSGYTGHFNEDVTGTYIGEGSEIWIDGKRYMIQLLSAGEGEATDEVTLSHTGIPSGKVEYIGGKWGYKGMAVGETTLDGFLISNTTINANTKIVGFAAGTWSQ